jgi:hypothetical protein
MTVNACIQQGAPTSPSAANTCANSILPIEVTAVSGRRPRVKEDETTDTSLSDDEFCTITKSDTCLEPTLKRPRAGKDEDSQHISNKPAVTLPQVDKQNKAPSKHVNCNAVDDDFNTQDLLQFESPLGFNGTINQSLLKRSVGLTRAVLNQHYVMLGLTSCFSMTVISKRGQNVSHLTLNHRWNDLPYNEHQMLKWWVGEGPSRVYLASPLNPALVQPQPIIPIFFAQTNKGGGGALCHYVGHYQCVHFETGQSVVFKSKPRQALLGFKFVRFDQQLADKLAAIAVRKEEGNTPAGNEYHEVVNQDPALTLNQQVVVPMDNRNTFRTMLVKEDPGTSWNQAYHFQASEISTKRHFVDPTAEMLK